MAEFIEVNRGVYDLVVREYEREFGMRTRSKQRAPFMHFLGRMLLSRGDIIDAAAFMRRYATTIPLPGVGPVAFLPWDPRPAVTNETWARRIGTIGHEGQHVVQMGRTRRERAEWSTGYVMSGQARADAEIEAYGLSITFAAYRETLSLNRTRIHFPGSSWEERENLVQLALDRVAPIIRALSNYFLSDHQLRRAEEELTELARVPHLGWETESGQFMLQVLKEAA